MSAYPSFLCWQCCISKEKHRTDRHQYYFPGMVFPSTVTSDILNNEICLYKWRDIWNPSLKCRLHSDMRWSLMIPSPDSPKGFATLTLGRVIRQDMSNPANFLSKTSLTEVVDQSPREDAPGDSHTRKDCPDLAAKETQLQQLWDGEAKDLKGSWRMQQTKPWVQERELQFVQSPGGQNSTEAVCGLQRTGSQPKDNLLNPEQSWCAGKHASMRRGQPDAVRSADWDKTQKEVYKVCKQDQMTKKEHGTT